MKSRVCDRSGKEAIFIISTRSIVTRHLPFWPLDSLVQNISNSRERSTPRIWPTVDVLESAGMHRQDMYLPARLNLEQKSDCQTTSQPSWDFGGVKHASRLCCFRLTEPHRAVYRSCFPSSLGSASFGFRMFRTGEFWRGADKQDRVVVGWVLGPLHLPDDIRSLAANDLITQYRILGKAGKKA